jgi:hypothetical protein
MKTHSTTLAFLLAFEIGNDQASTRFEHPGDFSESQTFEALRQMMHHQGREYHIECLIGEGDLLDHPYLELDGHVVPIRFQAGTSDLLCPWINACDAACSAYVALDFKRQRSRTTAHIQHLLSWLNAGQVDGSLPELPPLTMEQKSVAEPSHQVVAPTTVED